MIVRRFCGAELQREIALQLSNDQKLIACFLEESLPLTKTGFLCHLVEKEFFANYLKVPFLIGSLSANHGKRCFKNNAKVLQQGFAAGVGCIQCNPLRKIQFRAPGNLPKAGDAGLCCQKSLHIFSALRVLLKLIFKLIWFIGPRTNQRHFSPCNIKKLRQLVNTKTADYSAYFCDSRIFTISKFKIVASVFSQKVWIGLF